MKLARQAILLAAVFLISAGAVHAESKWSWKKLVPSFGKKDSAAPSGLYSKSNEPSLIARMNSGTKAFFGKTKEAIPPWLMPETQDRARRSGDSLRQGSDRVREEVRTAKRNIFAPWRQAEGEPEKPETVSDWLGNPRP